MRLRIREEAEAQGIRQVDLLHDTRTSWETLSNYWHNRVTSINVRVLERFAKALHVKPMDLLTDDDDEKVHVS